jgi:hypothetical protein
MGGAPTYPEAVFKEKHGVRGDPMPRLTIVYNSSYHIVNSVVREDLSYRMSNEHICICPLISKTRFLCKHKYREG